MSLPFYNQLQGTFALPPLIPSSRSPQRGLSPSSLGFERLALDSNPDQGSSRRNGHTRQSSSSSISSDAMYNPYPHSHSISPATSSPLTSRSPSPMDLAASQPRRAPAKSASPPAPRISKAFRGHTRSRSSISTASPAVRAPAFKLIPQPPLDPSKRPIRSSDALVVFPANLPPSTDESAPSPKCKAKLLMGSDIPTYFALQRQHALSNPSAPIPRVYAYRIVWDTRCSPSHTNAPSKPTLPPAGRRDTVC